MVSVELGVIYGIENPNGLSGVRALCVLGDLMC